MLIEIPDPEVILGIVVAFLGGLFALYLIYKIKQLINRKANPEFYSSERLEFYEKQLIDMKIRLDSLDISKESPKMIGLQAFVNFTVNTKKTIKERFKRSR